MNINQLRYFVAVVECGGFGKAARHLGLVTSALSQQVSRLESELATRLLQRTNVGVTPTDAGLAFFRQAQLGLRHIDDAARAAKQARLSGNVSVGMAPTTAAIMGVPLVKCIHKLYPNVQFHLVEALSGHLKAMLNTRQLDLAILFNEDSRDNRTITPLLDEHLYLIAAQGFAHFPAGSQVSLAQLAAIPLAMPTPMHGLRNVLTNMADKHSLGLNIAIEIDSLAMLMDVVSDGLFATIQPGIAIHRVRHKKLQMIKIADHEMVRRNLLVSLSDSELSPAGLAARVVIQKVASELVGQGDWIGVQKNYLGAASYSG